MLDERRERYRKRVLSFKPAGDEAALRNLLNGAKNNELFKHIFHGVKDDHHGPASRQGCRQRRRERPRHAEATTRGARGIGNVEC
ncbi:hypothetical protein [Paraburkholderia sp. HD33-4]|uniref:hypothetical protein n=1 Tax=Paraburkholderia sp. HD33-4 TaxID=2883242 RepID=UPI001F3E7B13|nr:hypothetical protein [Paraburkholderia sp. HD33-4]